MSLALSTLLYEWRRYMAAIVALAFSGLLVLAQVGMFMGIGKAFTAQIDRARADIMILSPGDITTLTPDGQASLRDPTRFEKMFEVNHEGQTRHVYRVLR